MLGGDYALFGAWPAETREAPARSSTRSGSAATPSAGSRSRRTRPDDRLLQRAIEYCRERARGDSGRASWSACRDGDDRRASSSAMPRRASDMRDLHAGARRTGTTSCSRHEPGEDRASATATSSSRAGRGAACWSTRAASGCRSTATGGPPTRSGTAAASSSCGASSTTPTATPAGARAHGRNARRRRRDARAADPAGRVVAEYGSARWQPCQPRPTASRRRRADARRRHDRPPARLRRDAHHRRGHLGRAGGPRRRARACCAARSSSDVNLIDTADSYGPEVSERLIAEALHPYPDDLVIATKGGLLRDGPGPVAARLPPRAPEAVPARRSLRRLRLDTIDLYQLHTPDPNVPFEESVGALAELREEGKVRHVGLSNVGVEQLEHGARDRPDRLGPEPLQPHEPRLGGRCSRPARATGSASSPGSRSTPDRSPTPTSCEEVAEQPRRDDRRRWRSHGCCSTRR